MNRIEKWLPVVGCEGSYEVSDHGRVRSVERGISGVSRSGNHYPRVFKGQLLANCVHSAGYHQVWVRDTIANTPRRKAFVHILVAKAFLGEPESEDLEICHWDGDPTNNHISNLRWDTRSANRLDCIRHGRHPWFKSTRKAS